MPRKEKKGKASPAKRPAKVVAEPAATPPSAAAAAPDRDASPAPDHDKTAPSTDAAAGKRPRSGNNSDADEESKGRRGGRRSGSVKSHKSSKSAKSGKSSRSGKSHSSRREKSEGKDKDKDKDDGKGRGSESSSSSRSSEWTSSSDDSSYSTSSGSYSDSRSASSRDSDRSSTSRRRRREHRVGASVRPQFFSDDEDEDAAVSGGAKKHHHGTKSDDDDTDYDGDDDGAASAGAKKAYVVVPLVEWLTPWAAMCREDDIDDVTTAVADAVESRLEGTAAAKRSPKKKKAKRSKHRHQSSDDEDASANSAHDSADGDEKDGDADGCPASGVVAVTTVEFTAFVASAFAHGKQEAAKQNATAANDTNTDKDTTNDKKKDKDSHVKLSAVVDGAVSLRRYDGCSMILAAIEGGLLLPYIVTPTPTFSPDNAHDSAEQQSGAASGGARAFVPDCTAAGSTALFGDICVRLCAESFCPVTSSPLNFTRRSSMPLFSVPYVFKDNGKSSLKAKLSNTLIRRCRDVIVLPCFDPATVLPAIAAAAASEDIALTLTDHNLQERVPALSFSAGRAAFAFAAVWLSRQAASMEAPATHVGALLQHPAAPRLVITVYKSTSQHPSAFSFSFASAASASKTPLLKHTGVPFNATAARTVATDDEDSPLKLDHEMSYPVARSSLASAPSFRVSELPANQSPVVKFTEFYPAGLAVKYSHIPVAVASLMADSPFRAVTMAGGLLLDLVVFFAAAETAGKDPTVPTFVTIMSRGTSGLKRPEIMRLLALVLQCGALKLDGDRLSLGDETQTWAKKERDADASPTITVETAPPPTVMEMSSDDKDWRLTVDGPTMRAIYKTLEVSDRYGNPTSPINLPAAVSREVGDLERLYMVAVRHVLKRRSCLATRDHVTKVLHQWLRENSSVSISQYRAIRTEVEERLSQRREIVFFTKEWSIPKDDEVLCLPRCWYELVTIPGREKIKEAMKHYRIFTVLEPDAGVSERVPIEITQPHARFWALTSQLTKMSPNAPDPDEKYESADVHLPAADEIVQKLEKEILVITRKLVRITMTFPRREDVLDLLRRRFEDSTRAQRRDAFDRLCWRDEIAQFPWPAPGPGGLILPKGWASVFTCAACNRISALMKDFLASRSTERTDKREEDSGAVKSAVAKLVHTSEGVKLMVTAPGGASKLGRAVPPPSQAAAHAAAIAGTNIVTQHPTPPVGHAAKTPAAPGQAGQPATPSPSQATAGVTSPGGAAAGYQASGGYPQQGGGTPGAAGAAAQHHHHHAHAHAHAHHQYHNAPGGQYPGYGGQGGYGHHHHHAAAHDHHHHHHQQRYPQGQYGGQGQGYQQGGGYGAAGPYGGQHQHHHHHHHHNQQWPGQGAGYGSPNPAGAAAAAPARPAGTTTIVEDVTANTDTAAPANTTTTADQAPQATPPAAAEVPRTPAQALAAAASADGPWREWASTWRGLVGDWYAASAVRRQNPKSAITKAPTASTHGERNALAIEGPADAKEADITQLFAFLAHGRMVHGVRFTRGEGLDSPLYVNVQMTTQYDANNLGKALPEGMQFETSIGHKLAPRTMMLKGTAIMKLMHAAAKTTAIGQASNPDEPPPRLTVVFNPSRDLDAAVGETNSFDGFSALFAAFGPCRIDVLHDSENAAALNGSKKIAQGSVPPSSASPARAASRDATASGPPLPAAFGKPKRSEKRGREDEGSSHRNSISAGGTGSGSNSSARFQSRNRSSTSSNRHTSTSHSTSNTGGHDEEEEERDEDLVVLVTFVHPTLGMVDSRVCVKALQATLANKWRCIAALAPLEMASVVAGAEEKHTVSQVLRQHHRGAALL